MSKTHPVIVVTGSSGAGTTFVKHAFEHIFVKENINPLIVEGDSFHKYDRVSMKENVKKQEDLGNRFFSHFGPDANLFDKIEQSFKDYGETGKCDRRYYLHSIEEAELHNGRLNTELTPGQFTPWEKVGGGTDLLFYEGLHGVVVTDDVNMAQYGDLKIGVVPSINLEWIQKIHRDNAERGYSAEETVDTILRRMPDYINYITPQFSQTDINFQRVATVDTSNPFIARDIPTPDESFVVIRFNDLNKTPVDFVYLRNMIEGSFMSRRNTFIIPGGKMSMAMEIILYPIIQKMVKDTNQPIIQNMIKDTNKPKVGKCAMIRAMLNKDPSLKPKQIFDSLIAQNVKVSRITCNVQSWHFHKARKEADLKASKADTAAKLPR